MNTLPQGAVGTWLKLPTVASAELAVLAGLDFVVIDLEHSTISLDTAASMIAVLRRTSTRPFVRVPDHAPSTIQRVLDAGALGIVAPHVENADEARDVARATRFQPRGARGVGPTSRAGDWGLTPWSTYLATDDAVTVIAQIESRGAAEQVDEILAQDIDGVLVGAADLSVEFGSQPTAADVVGAMGSVRARAQAMSKPCAIAVGGSATIVAQALADGYDSVIAGNDATLLGLAFRGVRPESRD